MPGRSPTLQEAKRKTATRKSVSTKLGKLLTFPVSEPVALPMAA